jgi:hypothetical protein
MSPSGSGSSLVRSGPRGEAVPPGSWCKRLAARRTATRGTCGTAHRRWRLRSLQRAPRRAVAGRPADVLDHVPGCPLAHQGGPTATDPGPRGSGHRSRHDRPARAPAIAVAPPAAGSSPRVPMADPVNSTCDSPCSASMGERGMTAFRAYGWFGSLGDIDTAPSPSSSSPVAERAPREAVGLDPLEEALVELARSALRNRREVAGRRGKMTVVEGGKQGGRTA